jgi:hypothetical protein
MPSPSAGRGGLQKLLKQKVTFLQVTAGGEAADFSFALMGDVHLVDGGCGFTAKVSGLLRGPCPCKMKHPHSPIRTQILDHISAAARMLSLGSLLAAHRTSSRP